LASTFFLRRVSSCADGVGALRHHSLLAASPLLAGSARSNCSAERSPAPLAWYEGLRPSLLEKIWTKKEPLAPYVFVSEANEGSSELVSDDGHSRYNCWWTGNCRGS
jgi:hypothetical protein